MTGGKIVLKGLPDNRRRIYFQQQLGSRQCDDLHHGAGWKVGAQEFSPRIVYVPMITNVGGEYVHSDNIVDRAAGSFHGPLNFLDHIARLGANIADANDVTLRI